LDADPPAHGVKIARRNTEWVPRRHPILRYIETDGRLDRRKANFVVATLLDAGPPDIGTTKAHKISLKAKAVGSLVIAAIVAVYVAFAF
jgi:hypothetical protein